MITRKTRNGMTILLVLSAVTFWLSRSQDDDKPAPVAGLDPELNYVLRDFELQFFDEFGQPTINMKAPVLRNDPKLQLGTIENPVVILNQADAVWDMMADTATVTADKEHVQLIGKVIVKRNEPATVVGSNSIPGKSRLRLHHKPLSPTSRSECSTATTRLMPSVLN